jgi:hypothetical protein
MPARLRLSWGMRTFRLFFLAVLESVPRQNSVLATKAKISAETAGLRAFPRYIEVAKDSGNRVATSLYIWTSGLRFRNRLDQAARLRARSRSGSAGFGGIRARGSQPTHYACTRGEASAMRTEEYFEEGAQDADRAKVSRILARVGKGNPPVEGDELPSRLVPKKVKK